MSNRRNHICLAATATILLFSLCGVVRGSRVQERPLVGHFTPLPSAESVISLSNGIEFDTRSGEPMLREDLRITGYREGESGYYLVQFAGPLRPEWKEEVEGSGGEVVAYIPHYALVVRLDEVSRQKVQALRSVRWVGVYQPAYKIMQDLAGAVGPQELTVVLFSREDGAEVISQLSALGAEIFEAYDQEPISRVRIRIDAGMVTQIAHLAGVAWIEPFVQPRFDNNNAQWIMQTHYSDNRRIWVVQGIRGEGEIVSACDSGIFTGHNMFNDPAVPIANWGDYPDHRKVIAYKQSDPAANFGDGAGAYWHGTHTSCTQVGDDSINGGIAPYDGMALKARIYYMDGGTNNDNLVHPGSGSTLYGLPYAGNTAGAARVMSNSWGSSGSGTYDAQCAEADEFMWSHKDFLIFFSNGNEGPSYHTTGSPAAAKNVVSVGALDDITGNSLQGFSSRGPAQDGRIKPTLLAPGELRSAVGPNAASYATYQGTSMSSPCLAGNAALIRQYLREGWYPNGVKDSSNAFSYISAALVKAILINGAVNDISGFTAPDSAVGWGRPCLDSVLYFSGDAKRLWLYDDTLGVNTGEYTEYLVPVVSAGVPLTITLVWTDHAGAPGSIPAIVNDLNLEVHDPFGTVYKGNVYLDGQSMPGGSYDALNVEENVRRDSPFTGIWRVRVNGQNIPYGPQPYAVVVTGGLTGVPYLRIGSQALDDSAGGNGDGQVDPAETIDLTIELRNTGSQAAAGTVGKLRTTSPYITVVDSSSDYGTIPAPGSSAGDMFTIHVSDTIPTGYTIPFDLAVSANADSFQTILHFSLLVNRFDTYDLDLGGVLLTVGKNGTIGFLSPGGAGNGFRYPKSSDRGVLYQGSFFLGSDSAYVMDAYGSSTDWQVGSNPDGRLQSSRSGDTLEIVSGAFTDSASGASRGITVAQVAEARSALKLEDVVFLKYRFTNNGSVPVEGLYAALYADFDIFTDVGWSTNLAFVDSTRDLAFVKWGTFNPCAGVCALGPSDAASWSVVDNTVYASAKEFPDSSKIKFMNGVLRVLNGTAQKDWSVLVSHGPFSLAPGQTDSVAYAVIGADNTSDLQAKADTARMHLGWVGIAGEPPSAAAPKVLALYQNAPNPVRNTATIRYALDIPGPTSLKVYNLSGQLVRIVIDEPREAGVHMAIWDGRDNQGEKTANGVYFYRLDASGRTITKKMVVLR